MTRTVGYVWRLREVMASHGVWKTTDLGPLLAERGVVLSAAQVYRLAAQIPERLSLRTLAALCDIFGCTPNELIDTRPEPEGVSSAVVAPERREPGAVVELAETGRPRRARVDPRS
jgi:DNA-binding Xre family transcriptional regulator